MNNKSILLDTGPLVAIIRTSQQNHKQCVATLATLNPPLGTCWPVLTEAAYLLRHRPNKVLTLLEMMEVGFLHLLPLGEGDLKNIRAIFDRFHDQSFQLADVCLMHLAER